MMSEICDLKLQHQNNHFLADLQSYDGKGDKSF